MSNLMDILRKIVDFLILWFEYLYENIVLLVDFVTLNYMSIISIVKSVIVQMAKLTDKGAFAFI